MNLASPWRYLVRNPIQRLFLVGVVAVAVTLTGQATIGSWRLAAAATDLVAAHVNFGGRLTPDDAAALLERFGATPVELQFQYAAGEREWSGGAAASGLNARTAAASYRRNAFATINDMLANAEHASARGAVDPEHVASLRAARGVFAGAVITGARVKGSTLALSNLMTDMRVREVRRDPERRASVGKAPGLAAPAMDHIPRANWVPNEVWAWIEPSSQGGRYMQQQWYWDTSRTITFSLDGGYEAEFRLDNSDGLTYLTRNEVGQRIPDVLAWQTDMPTETYLDTRYGQSTSEYSYTLGTVNAPSFLKGRWYYTYVRTIDGDASTDLGRVEPQMTYEFPSGCNNTWCMFTDSTCTANYGGNIWTVSVPRPASFPMQWSYFSNGCLQGN